MRCGSSQAGVDRLDEQAFYKEAARILRPGGTLAVWAYSLGNFFSNQEARDVGRRIREDIMIPHADPNWKRVRSRYVGEYTIACTLIQSARSGTAGASTRERCRADR